ncbi:hypothetical protein J6590_007271 [Homalodisca vitripennis]|nr:hypothetical protein J6590_007271 [Homalodisca vitripennis]
MFMQITCSFLFVEMEWKRVSTSPIRRSKERSRSISVHSPAKPTCKCRQHVPSPPPNHCLSLPCPWAVASQLEIRETRPARTTVPAVSGEMCVTLRGASKEGAERELPPSPPKQAMIA